MSISWFDIVQVFQDVNIGEAEWRLNKISLDIPLRFLVNFLFQNKKF